MLIQESLPTLHLRCGSDIQQTLTAGGFQGQFLEFADPYCQGPVSALPLVDFIGMRAKFISRAYGLPASEVSDRLTQEYAALATIPDFEQVVLWFEHDSYDQLILAFVLQYFAQFNNLPVLELICVDRVPGIDRFLGLGQLAPTDLQWLWQNCRVAVEDAHFELGQRIWPAIVAATPELLREQIQRGTEPIPFMAQALQRHLQELPSEFNGLSLTQQLVLEAIATQPGITGGSLFRLLVTEKEPLPFLGDSMFWYVLEDLQATAKPLFTVAKGTQAESWVHRSLYLSDQGRAVLQGDVNFLTVYRSQRWVGGILVQPSQPQSEV